MSEKRPLNRAEEVRRRRARDVARREQAAGQRAYRPLPPVTARTMPGFAPRPSGRRYQSALGGALARPGLSMPALPDSWSRARMISSVILLLLLGALYYAWTAPTFRVVEPQFTGQTRAEAAELSAGLGINGQPIFLMQPAELELRLRQQFPELASAEVTIGLPNRVQVRVTERQPIILWQQGDGYTWVDAAGVAFRPRGQADGLILVRALSAPPNGPAALDDPLSPPPYVSADVVQAIQTLAPAAPPGSTLIYDGRHGLGWNDARGWEVFFGLESQDMALKLQVYQALVDSLMQRNLYPAFISVVHVDAPYYRMAE
jgi:hypothetical protein